MQRGKYKCRRGTTTDLLVVNSKSNVSGGINNAIVALFTTAMVGITMRLTSVAQNGDYNYGAKVIGSGGVKMPLG